MSEQNRKGRLIRLADEKETFLVAGLLGRTASAGDVLLLTGGLGSGKTTFTAALARGLDVSAVVSSPSFALLHEYQGRLPLYHLDLYRLAGEEDVEDAGLVEYLETSGVTVVEWPERLGGLRPESCLGLEFHILPGTAREIILTPHGWSGEQWLRRFINLHQRKVDHEQADH